MPLNQPDDEHPARPVLGDAVAQARPRAGRGAVTGTVAEAMVTVPRTLPASVCVAEARAAFADPKVHLLLLTRGPRLVTTLTRADLVDATSGPARWLGSTAGRVTAPGEPLAEVGAWMRRTGTRRMAVIADDDRLLGLLCLKASGRGFCSDADVRARLSASQDNLSHFMDGVVH
ncbi:CBS domain-containing protein [Nocardioides sp. W3-2-3]|uniref:CBS domain-containing protein n=1 Tax=Nocardioides convexus TaxID=2712224 RepID=UPI0024183AD1|nr:hypothetical protein [Nocardioides convexus]NHA01115.1 CBS domain-containing protein [Nocardioides convexus]